MTDVDSSFLAYLRSLAIFVIVFGHVGGFWAFRPYSEFLHVFISMFFFISGAVSYYSFRRLPHVRSYYAKRIVGLLVPYYLLCILSLLVYCIINHKFPCLDIGNVLRWIQIRPSNAIMPFPVGQVWFLHTFFFVIIASPVYFVLAEKNNVFLPLIIVIIIVISYTQLQYDLAKSLYFFGNNLYKPLVFSGFFVFGVIAFTSTRLRDSRFVVFLLFLSLALNAVIVVLFSLNIDLSFHVFSPDIYYVLISYSSILIAFLLKQKLVWFVQKNKVVEYSFMFFHKHTFSIFILHTFSIYLTETIGGLVDPQVKSVTYGLVKLLVVLIVTCILAVPCTAISNKLSTFVMKVISACSIKKLRSAKGTGRS